MQHLGGFQGCKNRAHSVFLAGGHKDVPNQGVQGSVS